MKKITIPQGPLVKRLLWVIVAIIFYITGESFFVWMLEPENFMGGYRWAFVVLFPVILPFTLYINRKLGCASGMCGAGVCNIDSKDKDKDNDDFLIGTGRMP